MKRALLFLVLASCTHDIAAYDRVAVPPARDLDILYVFDNSPDRSTYDLMASQLDVLQARLKEVDGQVPNLHVGVVTTDLGTRGTLDVAPRPPVANCAGDGDAGKLVTFGAGIPAGGYLEDLRGSDGRRMRNFSSDDLGLELGRLTNPAPGTANTGCEFEQPLEAMRRALDPDTNPGFIRPGAQLSIVFLTNEDDCSLARGAMLDPLDGSLGPLSSFRCTEQGVICDGDDDPRRPGARTNCRPREGSPFMVDVSEYRTFLEKYKPDPRDVTVSAVVGARNPFVVRDIGVPTLLPSCDGAGGSAKPAVRIGAIVDSFGGVMVDGCTQAAAYQQITTPIVNQQRACFPNLRRADGEDCTVTEVAGGKETELARCADGSPAPCWYIYADAAACPGGDNIGIAVRRGFTTAPANPRIEATCFAK
ncbi:MAG TPA: hypothetical protein VN253_26930 [Kofleriaceae bacterium]|nr:hypothetical protein [Kofleriaceae bacterium]